LSRRSSKVFANGHRGGRAGVQSDHLASTTQAAATVAGPCKGAEGTRCAGRACAQAPVSWSIQL